MTLPARRDDLPRQVARSGARVAVHMTQRTIRFGWSSSAGPPRSPAALLWLAPALVLLVLALTALMVVLFLGVLATAAAVAVLAIAAPRRSARRELPPSHNTPQGPRA